MKRITHIFLVIILWFTAGSLFAQGPPAGDFPIDEEPIPIDGGITLLIGSGILFGAHSLKKRFSKPS